MEEKRLIRSRNLIYGAFFAAAMFLCLLFPYTGDDWAWGSSIGLDRLSIWFKGYNGRYIGNLIVLCLTRSNLLKSVVMAFCLTGILYCVHRIGKRDWVPLFGILCLLFLPIGIARQVVVWASGFANYAVSSFTTLIYLQSIYWIFDSRNISDSKQLCQQPVRGVLLMFLGAVNTLIVEHVTIYNLFLSLFVVGYVFLKYRRVLIQQVLYLAGTVFGTICMFSNSTYSRVLSGNDYYRTVATSVREILYRAWTNYHSDISPCLYMNNVFLNGVLLVSCICIYSALAKEGARSTRQLRALRIGLTGQSAYFVYSVFSIVYLGSASKQMGVTTLEAFFTLVSGFSLICFLLTAALHYRVMEKFLFIIGSILFLAASVLFVTPIGPRCFFITYVLFILLVVEVLKLPPIQAALAPQKQRLRALCHAAILAGSIFYFSVFFTIYRTDQARIVRARQMADAGEPIIYIEELPYGAFLHNADPYEDTNLAERFKLFYHLPDSSYLVITNQYGEPITPLP